MKHTVIYEVSEILDIFNLEEIRRMLDKQLNINGSSEITTSLSDHFKPLYYKYHSIVDCDENSSEVKQEAESRFMDICNIFLNMICKKFHLEIDDMWKQNHYQDIPGFTMALYSFFILEMQSNIYDVCMNYINKNTQQIFEVFEDRKTKKDAATLVNKKLTTPEKAVIISNIYDVTAWILNQISEEEFLNLLNQDYLPLNLIRGLLENGIMAGEFMEEINDIYASHISLKSNVCFNIITTFKKEIGI